MPISDLLTTQQAATRLGISPRTVVRWVEVGRLPIADRLGGRTGALLFDPEEIERQRQALAEPESAAS